MTLMMSERKVITNQAKISPKDLMDMVDAKLDQIEDQRIVLQELTDTKNFMVIALLRESFFREKVEEGVALLLK